MRYYIIAGEASGDLHGSSLIEALHARDDHAEIRCWGGDKMENAGAHLVKHYRDLAFMGFVEVIRHLPEILKNIRFCKQDILAFKPDVLVLIDYPGFNLRIATWAKQQGIKVCYYISPQVWAWKENRVATIKKSVDKMLVILPFEQQFYARHHFPVTYVGHPLAERIAAELQNPPAALTEKPILALLPGSRKQEIKKKLPIMLSVIPHFPNFRFMIAQAPGLAPDFYEPLIKNHQVDLLKDQTYDLLKQAKAALVTSGTATLETALFGVPEIVCYKGNPISYWLAKKLISVKYISLVNLILDKPAVRELIQQELTEDNLRKELHALLSDHERRETLQSDYTRLWEELGQFKSSEKASEEIRALSKS
jgi:lipid-A-disaccharide synthase